MDGLTSSCVFLSPSAISVGPSQGKPAREMAACQLVHVFFLWGQRRPKGTNVFGLLFFLFFFFSCFFSCFLLSFFGFLLRQNLFLWAGIHLLMKRNQTIRNQTKPKKQKNKKKTIGFDYGKGGVHWVTNDEQTLQPNGSCTVERVTLL